MKLDVLGIIGACSYALDCVEKELIGVTNNHAKRVAYMSVCMANALNISEIDLQNLACCALLHDNALTQYIQDECNNDIADARNITTTKKLGVHCIMGEENMKKLPFYNEIENVILYHHENACGNGPFNKKWNEIPLFARIIHLCDLLDAFCRTEEFTVDKWNLVNDFLNKNRESIFDNEVIDLFYKAFDEKHFLSLGDKNIANRLWNKINREMVELSFIEIKSIADFFARIVDYKSPFTSSHSIGVAKCAYILTKYLKYDENTCQEMYLAGALHDIGKVAIGNEILEKPDKLTTDEFMIMKDNASYTYYILSDILNFEKIRNYAALHHERLDGTGYPFKKTANELNTLERLMACVDIYQALTENRPYKKGMTYENAIEILNDMANKNWIDKDIVKELAICFN